MSQSFESFGAFAAFIDGAADKFQAEKKDMLEDVGAVVAELAQSKPGTYQDAVADFNAWPSLAPSTMLERRLLGFSEDEPLLRTGELRDSYGAAVADDSVAVGSPLAKAAMLEQGEENVPPRPVVGPAMAESEHQIEGLALYAVVKAFRG